MKQLLLDIQARLQAKTTTLGHIDEDWGQLDFFGAHPPVKPPCALIDSNQAVWSNQAKQVQMGLVQVTILIADFKITNTSTKAPVGQRENAFKIYDTLEDVYTCLQGWAGSTHYSKLQRISNKKRKRDDGMRIYEMVFTTELYDASAKPVFSTAPAVPEISELESE